MTENKTVTVGEAFQREMFLADDPLLLFAEPSVEWHDDMHIVLNILPLGQGMHEVVCALCGLRRHYFLSPETALTVEEGRR